MNWEKEHIEINDVKERTNIVVIFKGNISDGIPIKKIIPSCGCTKYTFDKKTNELIIKYKTRNIPYHLLSQGWYKTTKSITIIDMNSKRTVLTFKIKIIL